MIELKAIVRDKPQGRRRIRYMVQMEGSRSLVTKELNQKVAFNKENVLNQIAHDLNVKESDIRFNEDLFKEHKLDKKVVAKMIKEGGGMRRRHARD